MLYDKVCRFKEPGNARLRDLCFGYRSKWKQITAEIIPSSVMLRRVALVRTDVSEELSTSVVSYKSTTEKHPRRLHYT
jgi:hypothetical protein